MQLFVATPEGKQLLVGPFRGSDDISAIRRQLHAKRQVQQCGVVGEGDMGGWRGGGSSMLLGSRALRMQFAGKQLVEGVALEDYGLVQGATVHLLGRLRGGAQLGKVVKGRSPVKKAGGKPKEYAELQAKYNSMQDADAARQQAIAAKQELKTRVAQEEKNSKINRLKVQNQWRKIMRLTKVESLRRDIEILSQNHERDVDRKDAIIQMLDRDLEEAEDQFQTALRSNLQNMDALIDLQDSRLLELEQEFEAELRTLEAEFTTEREAIITQHESEVKELTDIMAAVAAQEEEREAEARQEHEQLREEVRNKNLEEINVLRITLDTQIEDLEQHFETAHINYLQNTDQRTTDFKYLTSRDQELSREIEVKIRKIERLQNSLQHWRAKIAQNVMDNAERNKLMTEERNGIQGHFQVLKGQMNKFREAQAKRLSELTQNASAAKKHLKQESEVAENILKLAEWARKMEAEHEKVLPFYNGTHSEEVERDAEEALSKEKEDLLALGKPQGGIGGAGGGGGGAGAVVMPSPLQASAWDKKTQPVQRWNHLDNLFKKFNRVLLDRLTVEREQERLERENADLRNLVKQYLDGISISENVLDGANPLLVVNGRINLSAPVTRRPEQHTHIEANHMVATNRVNTRVPL